MSIPNAVIRFVIKVLIVLIGIMLVFSLVELIFLVGHALLSQHAAFNFSLAPIDRSKLFLGQVQGFISAVLLLTILIELIYSLVEYMKLGSANYVTVITEIALIATVRHLLALDFEDVHAYVLLSLSALIFVLGLFYLVISKRIVFFNRSASQDKNDKH